MGARGELWFRVDASPVIGAGHFMRCLALAEQWIAERGRAVFVTSAPAALRDRLAPLGIEVVDLSECEAPTATLELADATIPRPAALVVDGYHFTRSDLDSLRQGRFLVMFDDGGDPRRHACDVLVDHGVLATAAVDPLGSNMSAPPTVRLLGPAYFPVRSELRRAGRTPREERRTRRVLITVGGTDPDGQSVRLLEALRSSTADDVTIRVVVGPLSDSRARLGSLAALTPGRVEITDGADMAGSMCWADVAVSAAGTTSLELAHLGVPSLLVTLVENQAGIAQRLEDLGVAIAVGTTRTWDASDLHDAVSTLLDDRPRQAEMSARGRMLVDGRGAERITRRIGGC